MIDHYENPRNVGSMDKSDKNVGTGLVGAPACGDVMKLQVSINLICNISMMDEKKELPLSIMNYVVKSFTLLGSHSKGRLLMCID